MKTTDRKRGKKRNERPVFDAIRKAVAPPGHPLGRAKPEDRAHPAKRKTKHKRPTEEGD